MLEYRYWAAECGKSWKMALKDIKFRMILKSILMCHAIVEFLGKFFFQSSKKTRGTGGTVPKIG